MSTDYPLDYGPIADFDDDVIARCVAPLAIGSTVYGVRANKAEMNRIYTNALNELHNLIKERDIPGWLHEAYRQLELWTLMYWIIKRKDDDLYHMKTWSKIGRYGWRYVIDIALAELNPARQITLGTPRGRDIKKAWTLLVIMEITSEYSNTLHYFADKLEVTGVGYAFDKNDMFDVTYPEPGNAFMQKQIAYLLEGGTSKHYPDLHPYVNASSGFCLRMDAFLEKHFGFNMRSVSDILNALLDKFKDKGSVILSPGDRIVEMVSEAIQEREERVRRVILFVLLSKGKIEGIKRDFLRKAQTERMFHHAGILVPTLADTEMLYYHVDRSEISSAEWRAISLAEWHMMLSPGLLAEWRESLGMRVMHGQRPDLKRNAAQRLDIEAIEEYFRKDVFEVSITSMMETHGFRVVRQLKDYQQGTARVELQCGEIDCLGIRPDDKTMLLVEAKCFARVWMRP